MFRVECTSCKAAYQVDERRVPAKGLTMKCPKCRESFLVSPPDKPAEPVEKVALPAPTNNFGGTMIGVSARRDALGGPSRAADPNNQTQIGLAGPRGMKGNDATMIGVAPSSASAAPNDPLDLPAVRATALPSMSKTGRTQDLPVSSPPGPLSHAPNTQDTAAELPAIKNSKAPAAAGAFATVTSKKTSRINLSSLAQPSKTEPPRAEPTRAEPFKLESKAQPVKLDPTKREPFKSESLPGAEIRFGETERSAPKADTSSLGLDLAATEAELPAVVTRAAKNTPDLADALLDLPAVIGSSKNDSPLTGQSAPPSGRLFKPTSPELPAVKSKQPPSPDSHASLFDLDLPAVFSDRGSKLGAGSTAKGGNTIPQPSAKSVSPISLSPNPRSVAPDEVVDLDSEALESLAPSGAPAANNTEDADLPEVAGLDLPDVLGGTALPALPSQFDDAGLGFGELDLPTIGGNKSGGGRSDSELPLIADFGQKLPSFAPSEPPAGRVSSQPPSFRARQDSFGEFEGVPSFAPSTNHPSTLGSYASDDNLDDGLLDGESFSLGDERHSVSEAGAGETNTTSQPPRSNVQRPSPQEYGQVNLDAGGSDADDEMEFGGIPQADSEPPKGAVALDGRVEAAPMEPVVAPTAAARPKPTKGTAEVKKTRGAVKFAAVAAVVVAVGGGALALEPDIGPFGVYAAQDLFLRGEHEALQTRSNQAVEAARALDSYAASVQAVTAMDEGRGAAKRFVPLKADTAAQALALALRFGGPASLQSTGQVLVSELLASSAERAELRRAQVVEHVLKRQPNAPSELAALPRDLFTLTVEGEHWLRVESVDNAISSWTEAVNQKRCAWTVFGLARAHLAANQLGKALEASKQVSELNPDHVGAKLMQVDAAIRGGTFDPSAIETLQGVLNTPGNASPSEVTLAHTLKGEFEFGIGKTSSAIDSFEAALAVVPGDARALTSSARALFASGRHAAALARYQSAVTAAPEALAPRVGVARTQLALDQLDQAVLLIQNLRTAYPKDVEVAFLSGLATFASGEIEIGRKVLQEAIELSKQPPPARFAPPEFQRVAVEAYVALATSFTKAGEPERAAPILTEAGAQLPGSSALRVATGDVAFGQGQFENALAQYAEARKLSASDSTAAFKEGQALSRIRRFDEAKASFDKVAEIDANYPGLPLERGLILDKSGKAAEALAQYEQALKNDPADLDVQLRVGCGRVEAGQGAAAATVLKDVLVKRPHSAEANYCLGRAMFAEGNTVEALRLMRAAVEYDSNSALYRLHLGWVASDLGQVAVARRELNRALELDQGAVDAYWQRGLLNLKQGAARDATTDFKKALELNPAHLGANADMAQALAQLGKEGDAMPYWEKAIAGDGNNSVWLFRYGKVLVGRNQREKGTELLLRALKLVDGQSPAPNWLWQAHYLVALGLGANGNAVQHWRRYLELSPHDSPYRSEAKRALSKAGQPWDGQ